MKINNNKYQHLQEAITVILQHNFIFRKWNAFHNHIGISFIKEERIMLLIICK